MAYKSLFRNIHGSIQQESRKLCVWILKGNIFRWILLELAEEIMNLFIIII